MAGTCWGIAKIRQFLMKIRTRNRYATRPAAIGPNPAEHERGMGFRTGISRIILAPCPRFGTGAAAAWRVKIRELRDQTAGHGTA
ncbi:hypothetical protein B7486_12335 [cyanobacterium TDX16]|nr:hypothetical protein B7486_12335 [cyanobacterium TDX16]